MTTLLVHAHPDDESIYTGATMAHLVSSGERVVLVTCTRGERGEVIPTELAHLEGNPQALSTRREAELREALRILGVTHHHYLGDEVGLRLEDSGMVWKDGIEGGTAIPHPETPPCAFAKYPAEDATDLLGALLQRYKPSRVITYEPGGVYGHPDHLRSHEVTMQSAARYAPNAEVWWTVLESREYRAGLRDLRAAGFTTADPEGELSSGFVERRDISELISAPDMHSRKRRALRAHRTQITVSGSAYALSNNLWQPISSTEYFMKAHP